MARIMVLDDDRSRHVLLDEKDVSAEHLSNDHSAIQLLDRLEWAIRDADHTRRPQSNRRTASRRRVAFASKASAGPFE
jgi:hypothetical protein